MSRFKFFIFLIFLDFSLTFADEECGKVKVGTSFSIGGVYSEPGEWPWLAALHRRGKYQCGASIISRRHLLGAAHCVHPKGISQSYPVQDFHALLGVYELGKNVSKSIKVQFSDIFLHSDWDPDIENLRYDADIAVFLMAFDIQYNNLIQPICLPKAHAKVFDVHGTVVGYGLSETSQPHENLPKHVQIRSVEYEVCLFQNFLLGRVGSSRMFCAGERGKNPCKGDSGGPFMVQEDDNWSINGIVSSSASGECHENDFVLFTRVPLFLEWIKEKMGGDHNQLELKCGLMDGNVAKNKFICLSSSLIVLEPNRKVTSISLLSESLKLNEINWIQIWQAQVHYLPDFSIVKEKFPNLKVLWIRSSGLKELDRSKLALLPKLTQLNVGPNEIQEFPHDVFDDLVNLEWLLIWRNQVKILPQKLLWKLSKLNRFDASHNHIEAIPARFFEMNQKIEFIGLNNNKILRIDIDLNSLTKLKSFALKGNQCIDKNFNANGESVSKEEFQKLIEDKCP